jgi:hypothetical protein
MREDSAPDRCPQCGGSRLVRILWGYSALEGRDAVAVETGRALLGLNRRYFRALRPRDPAPALLLEKTRLRRWACLDCVPRWLDLHRLTLAQWDAETAIAAAYDAGEFERVAALLHAREELERGQGTELLVLLRELAGDAVPD